MKTIKYKKSKVNVGTLDKELRKAGFSIYGVTNDTENTFIHLKDNETKNPLSIINSHIYVKPLTEEEKNQNLKTEFNAATIQEKLIIIAKKLDLE